MATSKYPRLVAKRNAATVKVIILDPMKEDLLSQTEEVDLVLVTFPFILTSQISIPPTISQSRPRFY